MLLLGGLVAPAERSQVRRVRPGFSQRRQLITGRDAVLLFELAAQHDKLIVFGADDAIEDLLRFYEQGLGARSWS